TIWRGWVLATQNHKEEGVVRMQEGLAAHRATGAEAAHPYFLALQAEIYGKLGQAEEGLNTLTVALAAVEKTGERWYEAELYRLKGDLALKQTSVPGLESSVKKEGEACFLKAAEIAQKQQAKSLELRAAMSLARLWQKQGKHHEAHHLLSEI